MLSYFLSSNLTLFLLSDAMLTSSTRSPHAAFPRTILSQLCGDNAECILDALLAGEEVGQATLDAQAEDQLYQEEVAGECVERAALVLCSVVTRSSLLLNLPSSRGRSTRKPSASC